MVIYPQKRIPTVNVMPVGKSGPLANFITEDIYVSAVTSKQISLAEEGEAVQAAEVSEKKEEKAVKFNADQKVSETLAAQENKSIITKVGLGVGKFVNTFYQAGRDAIQTCITTLLPFMAFVSLLVGIINGSGFGNCICQTVNSISRKCFWTGCSWCNLFYPRFIRFTWTRCRYRTDCRNINRNRNWKGNNRSTACTSSPFRNQLSGACDFIPVGLGLAEAERNHRSWCTFRYVFQILNRLDSSIDRVCSKLWIICISRVRREYKMYFGNLSHN